MKDFVSGDLLCWPDRVRGARPGEGQNCTGQKCTEHELVLLMFFVLKRLDDLL